ncbi:MAG: hypothetical protein LUQ11_02730 [Methylococcaceae bacterium]|nr:hypothetical protein [Methylococcaceae bacterium]
MAEIVKPDAGQIPLFSSDQLPRRKKPSEKGLKAQRVINKYTVLAGGLGLIPVVRLAGQVAVSGLLVKLLADLCRIYGVAFSDQQNKILVAAILGGAHYEWISRYLLKLIGPYSPVPHSPAVLLLRPAISGLLVYYIGRLFLVHLESGVWYAAAEKCSIKPLLDTN